MKIYKKKREVSTDSKNARIDDKIRLYGHLRRFKKIIKNLI